YLGGLPWWVWLGAPFFLAVGLVGWWIRDAVVTKVGLAEAAANKPAAAVGRELTPDDLKELGMASYHGPEYPHPVIFSQRCIGCHACIEACPHDVLAMVDGVAAVVAAEQCMEDTSCQVECPVNPKACLVVHTTKKIKPRPAPVRDGSSYETDAPGCYLIGDVSGVPLIKNAVKEGAEVVGQVARALDATPKDPLAEYDVAIIGAGPGGASAAAAAQERGLRYVSIEQDKILATIAAYPVGKYIFFKPEYRDWFGGLGLLGLGWISESGAEAEVFKRRLSAAMQELWDEQAQILSAAVVRQLPTTLQTRDLDFLSQKLDEELQRQFAGELFALLSQLERAQYSASDLPRLFDERLLTLAKEDRVSMCAGIRTKILQQLSRKVPGEQRERILEYWCESLREKGVRINEGESCRSIVRAPEGDHFIVSTERLVTSQPVTYRARRVVLAIGLRGTPSRLRVPGEELRVTIDGREQEKVLYRLANPDDFHRRQIVVVGGGNSAVEAAIDLVADREGQGLSFRPAETANDVTLLVRSEFKTDLKFGNKLLAYQCVDAGRLKIHFRSAIKEIRPGEVVVVDSVTSHEKETIPNDLVFALLGGERPDKFLESIGIQIRR
ncbi:MAG: NAD(P)-binding domain-containing protein, partial [Pyrinomonadaceae bacterium]